MKRSSPAPPAPAPFAIVGFDLDGTLVDSHRDLAAALNHALARAGRAPLGDAVVRGLVGGGVAVLLDRALALTGGALPAAETEPLRAALVSYYADHVAVHSRLFPGVEAMLDTLAAQGIALAVVTNKLEGLALPLIAALGLKDRFYTVIGGDTLGPGRGKPSPEPLLEMVARAPVHNSTRAAYVGDTTYDVRAARAAGMPCVAVSFGFNDLPAHQLGADAVIDDFSALAAALAGL